jgi:hypothetical protein
MATWQEAFRYGREVASLLKMRGRPTVRYANAHGTAVDGWLLYNIGTTKDEEKWYGSVDYKEVHTETHLILGNDGVIYEFTVLRVENGRRESNGFRVVVEKTPSAHPIPPRTFQPTWYQSLDSDDIVKALERLASKENSDPEPPAPDIQRSESFSEDPVRSEPPAGRTAQPAQRRYEPYIEKPSKERPIGWGSLLLLVPFLVLALIVLIVVLTNDVQFH